MKKKIAIVGAGLAGLSAASLLAKNGHDVTVFEKNAAPGGRMNRLVTEEGFKFDTGPTLLLMLSSLRKLFTKLEKNIEDYMELKLLEPSYRVFYADGTEFNSSTNIAMMTNEIREKLNGDADIESYLKFFSYLSRLYRLTIPNFVDRNYRRLSDFINPKSLYYLATLKMLGSLYGRVSNYFRDERLKMLFSFQTMYLGISPFEAPSVYGVVTYMESGEGIYFPVGGMYKIVESIQEIAVEYGVKFRYNSEVTKIEKDGDHASSLVINHSERETFDVYLVNADLPYAYETLLDETPKKNAVPNSGELKSSSSAYMMYLGTDKQYKHLLHHNVVFSGDYKLNLDDIFKRQILPEDPAFYVCIPNRSDASLAPEGGDSIYVLVPVPHKTPNIDWNRDEPAFRERILNRMSDRLGMTDIRDHIVYEKTFTPDAWANEYNLWKGSAFGLSHSFFQSAYFRPQNKSKTLNNVYFAGASTVPGNGIPMVIISGSLAAERIEEDLR